MSEKVFGAMSGGIKAGYTTTGIHPELLERSLPVADAHQYPGGGSIE